MLLNCPALFPNANLFKSLSPPVGIDFIFYIPSVPKTEPIN